jgi:formylglycine-generating enzyme required for sulfatase activity
VSWSDAHRYTAWLSQATGHQYRLLTEAEWEYAARAQAGASAPPQRFSWGEQDPACVSRASNGAAVKACGQWTTWPAAAFPANAFGLHDMHGNVSE